MKNETTDNKQTKVERVIKCELCNNLFSLYEVQKGMLTGNIPANFVFDPYICDPCYQEVQFS